ncbi:MAG TPA: RidA family protein, partial [Thermomicrobiales bacterium]|nr:RidA family protein [Thermomicrobiales bacterium]
AALPNDKIVRVRGRCGSLDGRTRIMKGGRGLTTEPQTRRRVASGSPYESTIGFSRAVRVGQRVLVSGTAPIWPDGSCDPDPEAQARRCLEIILTALRETGARAEDVVRTRMFITDAGYGEAVGRAHGEVFAAIRPAATMVVVAALLDSRWKVEIEAEAIVSDEQ